MLWSMGVVASLQKTRSVEAVPGADSYALKCFMLESHRFGRALAAGMTSIVEPQAKLIHRLHHHAKD
jgi:hypothetical protein